MSSWVCFPFPRKRRANNRTSSSGSGIQFQEINSVLTPSAETNVDNIDRKALDEGSCSDNKSRSSDTEALAVAQKQVGSVQYDGDFDNNAEDSNDYETSANVNNPTESTSDIPNPFKTTKALNKVKERRNSNDVSSTHINGTKSLPDVCSESETECELGQPVLIDNPVPLPMTPIMINPSLQIEMRRRLDSGALEVHINNKWKSAILNKAPLHLPTGSDDKDHDYKSISKRVSNFEEDALRFQPPNSILKLKLHPHLDIDTKPRKISTFPTFEQDSHSNG